MLARTFAVLTILALAACAGGRAPLTAPPETRSIGIVTALPAEIRIATTGMTIFENALDVVDVSDWQLDATAWEAASAALATRVRTVRATVDAPIVDKSGLLVDRAGFEAELRAHVHCDEPVDLYLVVSPAAAANPPTQLPNILREVGVSKMRSLFVTHDPVVHAFLELSLVDAKTFKVVSATLLRVDSNGSIFGLEPSRPADRLDGFAWKDYWHEMSDAQHDLVRDRLTRLLKRSLTYTVGELRFGA